MHSTLLAAIVAAIVSGLGWIIFSSSCLTARTCRRARYPHPQERQRARRSLVNRCRQAMRPRLRSSTLGIHVLFWMSHWLPFFKAATEALIILRRTAQASSI